MGRNRRKNLMNLLFVLIPVAVLFYLLNYLTPIAFDDHTYAFSFDYTTGKQRIISIMQIPESMYYHYFSMNGRLVTHFLAQVYMMLGKSAFNVVNTIAFILLGIVMYIHAYGSMKVVRAFPLIFIYSGLFLFSPSFGSSFLWLTGASNYLHGPLLALLFILPYRLVIDNSRKIGNNCIASILFAAGMLVFGIIVGDTNENNAVTIVVATVVFLCVKLRQDKRVSAWMATGAVGVLAGCLLNLLSPGTGYRAVGKDMSILASIKRAAVNTVFALERHGIFLLILAVLVSLYFARQIYEGKTAGIKKSILVFLKENCDFDDNFLMFGLSFYSMSPVPYFTERAWSIHLIYLIIAVVVLYKEMQKYIQPSVRKFVACALSAALILHVSSVYVLAYKDLEDVKEQHENRISIIQEAKDFGERTVTLPAITSDSPYSVYPNYGDVTLDHTYWANTQIAKYYGFDVVYLAADRNASYK